MSEWLDVMLEEIARKKAEADAARAEHERRQGSDSSGVPPDALDLSPAGRAATKT